MFIATLGQTCDRTGWIVHSYVLMRNHYHLLLETPKANLSLGMQWFQGTYTQRYSIRHSLVGHVFEGWYLGEDSFRDQLLDRIEETKSGPTN